MDANPALQRVRVGVAQYPDGWNVIVNTDGEIVVYDPTYATEAEAEAKANEVSAFLRSRPNFAGPGPTAKDFPRS